MRAQSRWLAIGWLVGLAASAGGCKADDDFPLMPGGPNNGGGKPMGGVDASVDGSGGGAKAVSGKVCVVADLRRPDLCSPTVPDKISVREAGTSNAITTGTGGVFSLPVSAVDVAVLEVGVGNADLVPSLVSLSVGSTTAQAPSPRTAEYTATLTPLTGLPPDGTGVIAIYFVDRTGRSLPGVTVQAPAGSSNAPLYDVATAAQWVADGGTGPFGASLLVGVPAGTVEVVAFGPGNEDLGLKGVRVADGHVTFVTSQSIAQN